MGNAPTCARHRGRHPSEKGWYSEAAILMAEGLTLRKALRKLGITNLSEADIKNTYRRVRFRRLLREARGERDAEFEREFSMIVPVG